MNSVTFGWNINEFNDLLDCCNRDDAVQYCLKVFNKNDLILEAGCGIGRVVKFLHDKRYKIEGIEKNGEIVKQVKQIFPELNMIEGDVSDTKIEDNKYDGIISLGVIEHFIDGPEIPLQETYRILKTGGRLVITVPSYNKIRQEKYKKNSKWYSENNDNGFFEYRFTPEEFELFIINSGFQIINSIPICHLDGMYHEKLGNIEFRDWKFFPDEACIKLNEELKQNKFYHNHMHLIEATK